jgi:rare lipoprotein A
MIQKLFVGIVIFSCHSWLYAQSQAGIGTYYHARFWGSRTSSGEVYHPYVFSAAHRTLPFGTWVEVELLKTGKKTIVKVNDRGPFFRGGLIDVSKIAANELGLVAYGNSKVKIRPLSELELTDSLKSFLFKRDSLAKVEHPKPMRKSTRKKKNRKRKKR